MPAMPHRTSALRQLAEARADLDVPLRSGQRPLHLAVGADMRIEAALLLEYAADANGICSLGTPLHVAAQQGTRDCVDLLLRARSDPTITNAAQQTPIEVARQCGFPAIEQLIQRFSAND